MSATSVRQAFRGRREALLWGAAGLAALAIALQAIPGSGLVNPAYFPPLTEILASLGDQLRRPEFWSALGSTVTGWLIGLGIAVVAGSLLGVLIASVPILDRMLASTVEFLRPIPSVALVPIAALLFGTTMQATLLLVVFGSFWPVLLQVIYGVRDVDRVALETARSYRLGLVRTVARVIWPSMTPYLIVGVRLAASVALILEITGELVIATPGLGKLIALAQSSAAIGTMYALVLVAALLGVIINVGTRALERRAMFWHASVRAEAAR
ncbi:ABC transporter permease [Leucobacter allii]|uniref:ABC transporter permease n=1 Tax=Leucobacter allii TaxID=2932247 RepID=A0ABY4FMB2_9MICO|nr:ABC transporter permease [Leucobacter allii]UOQ57383.1 ABC transporter permease [Leucobacter allii]UOR01831.1 ABC transporter permease [Leucobacter allii]